ncbi:hypothetical protein FQN60_011564 [Etheostoma spectabile]|uniref:Ig-like domain-containing protein n=1 Tax=Etheostoma spectabile TaxID=54343 RepID=A0A5J5DMM2_9PERO|nr:hypothetical protein FQN60_011564 [Etheostoma spectabile]
MKSYWIMTILLGFITMASFWMPFVPAAEVQHVQYGSTVTLGCNLSYLYDTTWLRQNSDLTPTVVLRASLRDGQPVQGFQVSSRFSVELMQRSLALKITSVEERDLGLYYCIGNVNAHLTVGRGTILQVSSLGSSLFLFQHWHCVGVGLGLLIMVLAVCITHWKAKSNKETTNKTPTASSTKKDNTNSS